MGEARVWLPGDDDAGPHAVFELANLRDEGFALPDRFGGPEGRVDDADGGGEVVFVFSLGGGWIGAGGAVGVRG